MDYISENDMERIAGETGRALAAEKKRAIVIGETQDGAMWEGGLNGYFFRIKRGVPVEVPETLAELIAENAQVSALSHESYAEYRRGRGKKLSS